MAGKPPDANLKPPTMEFLTSYTNSPPKLQNPTRYKPNPRSITHYWIHKKPLSHHQTNPLFFFFSIHSSNPIRYKSGEGEIGDLEKESFNRRWFGADRKVDRLKEWVAFRKGES